MFHFLIFDCNIRRKAKIVTITYSNKHYSYGPNDLDKVFREKNKDILSRERGNGYWLWKSYIINKTIIEKLNERDYLIYTDCYNDIHEFKSFIN